MHCQNIDNLFTKLNHVDHTIIGGDMNGYRQNAQGPAPGGKRLKYLRYAGTYQPPGLIAIYLRLFE